MSSSNLEIPQRPPLVRQVAIPQLLDLHSPRRITFQEPLLYRFSPHVSVDQRPAPLLFSPTPSADYPIMIDEEIERRLNFNFINSLTPLKKSNDKTNEKCSICLEKCKKDFCKTKCKHYFHIDCLNKWREINNNCPYCRRKI
jgi:hypothetical protein